METPLGARWFRPVIPAALIALLLLKLASGAPYGPVAWSTENRTDSGARWECKETAVRGSLVRECYVTFKRAGNGGSSAGPPTSGEAKTEPVTDSRPPPETLWGIIYWILKGPVVDLHIGGPPGEPAPSLSK